MVNSPASQDVIQLKDSDCCYEYIEFPSDVFFMESMANNASFQANVGYIAAQRKINERIETHLYKIQPGTSSQASFVCGPIATPEGDTDVTVFGSHLTSDGILYLCAFNRNSIMELDLKPFVDTPGVEGDVVTCQFEVGDLPSPNDMCVDPEDESILYVAGGTFTKACLCGPRFSNSSQGQVFKVVRDREANTATTTVFCDNLYTLAGIESLDGKLWLAQLFNCVSLSKGDSSSRSSPLEVWKGNNGKGQVWMADNLAAYDDEHILCPAYALQSEFNVNNVMRRRRLAGLYLLYLQIKSLSYNDTETFGEALIDPEVSLSFSNTYLDPNNNDKSPLPIMLFAMNTNTNRSVHWEIDLHDTREKHSPYDVKDVEGVVRQRHYFNEQVTHAARLAGHIVCVNFEQPRVLLLKEDRFQEAIADLDKAIIR